MTGAHLSSLRCGVTQPRSVVPLLLMAATRTPANLHAIAAALEKTEVVGQRAGRKTHEFLKVVLFRSVIMAAG